MNKIYEEQLKINRFKLDESGSGNVWNRKSVSRLNIPQGNPVAPSARQVRRSEKVENPEEPESELSNYTGTDLAWDVAGTVDPTGVVDLVNAGRYALKGQYADSAISLAGVVPVVGDLAKGARAATRAVHTGEVIGRAATKASKSEIAQAAADMLKRKMGKPKVTVQPAKSGALATIKRNAASAATGAAAATAANAAVEYVRRKIKDRSSDGEFEESKTKRIINDPIPDIGLNLHRLSAFDPGEPSGYSRSTVQRRGLEGLPPGYHPYFTGPVNVELERRRSYYAQRHALPESIDIKNKIKQSVDSYLKSKEGKKLNDHLDSVKNTLAKI